MPLHLLSSSQQHKSDREVKKEKRELGREVQALLTSSALQTYKWLREVGVIVGFTKIQRLFEVAVLFRRGKRAVGQSNKRFV